MKMERSGRICAIEPVGEMCRPVALGIEQMRRNRRQSWAPAVFKVRAPTSSVSLTTSCHTSTKIEHIEVGLHPDVSKSINKLRPCRYAESGLNISLLDGAQSDIPITIGYQIRIRIGFVVNGNVYVAVVRVEIARLNFWKIKDLWIAMQWLIDSVVFRYGT
eukprot:CAMPEP_0185015810 /NCGR_PEP_ID=MMETSP1098-20130426/100028_1 /TAXON_ID=89044 /ORGANISM="Spumella elongata, Strain CCAP 955/1" /LENGTH=160 /DNA_ID=CAMNT_0027544951 /DNA_START=1369 /DNA_END=1851 /DNA_ORIENTATION=+